MKLGVLVLARLGKQLETSMQARSSQGMMIRSCHVQDISPTEDKAPIRCLSTFIVITKLLMNRKAVA